MKNKVISIITAIVLAGGVLTYFGVIGSKPNCINVYVDYGSLKNNQKQTECIKENGKTNALDLVQKAGYFVQGTQKYGLQVVCRVNGLPDASKESCTVMPKSNAYWALIVENKKSPTNVIPKWNWASVGISTLYLYPGDSVGLTFTENNKVRWPN